MKQLAVISGKGGTGKTTVSASFISLSNNKVAVDCDVDAPNLHLLLHPQILEKKDFYGSKIAVRDKEKCIQCGACELRCRFDAITCDDINTFACEGCGLCVLVCPSHALRLETAKSGEFYLSETKYGPMIHAKLVPGGESSGLLVTKIRELAKDVTHGKDKNLIIIDGPPGIGCTSIASIVEVDLAVIVTEPTLSGIHDMKRVIQLTDHFGIPVCVVINKADLNENNSKEIQNYCEVNGKPIIGTIPFDEDVTKAIAAGIPLVEFSSGPASSAVKQTWEKVKTLVS
jgi:MinD superfamily P-loop ATPase